jgi:hypothetical protein
MQARRWACGGTRASKSALKSARVHQHLACAMPVRFSISLAHSFGFPQSGQAVASGVAVVVVIESPRLVLRRPALPGRAR